MRIIKYIAFAACAFSALAQTPAPQSVIRTFRTLAEMDASDPSRTEVYTEVMGLTYAGQPGWPLKFRYEPTNSAPTNMFCRALPGGKPGRRVHDWNGDVRAFGADERPGNDDTAALQAAADYCASFKTNRPYLNLKGKSYGILNTLYLDGVSVFGNDHDLFPNRRLARGNAAVIEDVIGSTSHAMLVFRHNDTVGGNPINESPTVAGITFLGHAEANPPANLVTITGSTNRLHFTVASGLPTYSPAGSEPWYGWASFWSPQTRYLGSGMIYTVDSTNGVFTLVPGTDNYATTNGATLLGAGYKVAFPQEHTVTNYSGAVITGFSSPKAHRSAIAFEACSDPTVKHCFFYKWSTAIVSYASDGAKFEDIETQGIQFASIAGGIAPYDSDWRIGNSLLIGRYVSDYTENWPAESGTWDGYQFRTQVTAVDNWPVQSYGSHVVTGPGMHAATFVTSSGVTIHDLLSEGNYREPVRIYRGASSVPVGYLDPINITTLRVHDSVDPLPAARTNSNTAIIKVGPWGRIYVDHLSVGRFPGADTNWFWNGIFESHFLSNQGLGAFEDPLGLVQPFQGVFTNAPTIVSPSSWTFGLSNYSRAAKFVGGASGVGIAEFERAGVGTWGLGLGTSTMNIRQGTGSAATNVVGFTGTSVANILQFGGGSGSASPIQGYIYGPQTSGSNVASLALNLSAGRGTGTGSVANAVINFGTPTPGSDGSTLQSTVNRMTIREVTVTNETPIDILVNGVTRRILLGTNDSGGAGYQILRVLNTP